MYIFIDESGDLGKSFASGKSSKFFVIAYFIVDDMKTCDRVYKRVNQRLYAKKGKKIGAFHATKESLEVNQKLLQRISQIHCEIGFLVLEKRENFHYDDIHGLYNNLVLEGLEKIISERDIDDFSLYLSKREKSKFLNAQLIQVMQDRFGKRLHHIESVSYHHYSGLQLVDTLAWAMYQDRENNQPTFVSMIENKVIFQFRKTL